MEQSENQQRWEKTGEKYSEEQMCTCLLPWHQKRELIIPLALAQGGQANDLLIIALGKGAKKHSKEERADL